MSKLNPPELVHVLIATDTNRFEVRIFTMILLLRLVLYLAWMAEVKGKQNVNMS